MNHSWKRWRKNSFNSETVKGSDLLEEGVEGRKILRRILGK
jgi:hypothetical protein